MALTAERLFIPFIVLLALVGALLIGNMIGGEDYLTLGLFIIAVLATTWTIVGYNYWWLPIFFFMTLGGHFFVGFRIFTHELAVMLCLAPMVLALAVSKGQFKEDRMHIPILVLILFGYLVLHFVGMMIYLNLNQLPGLGNIIRRYMDAIWPFLILVPFLWIGKTKYVSWALHLVAAAAFIRFGLSFIYYLTERDEFLYVPGINYIPAGGGNPQDMRFSGSMLAMLGVAYFCMAKNWIWKIFLISMILLGVYGTFLGGGRISVVLLGGLFGFTFLIYRNYAAIFIWVATMFISILILNTQPEIVYSFPERAQRAATAFLLDREFAATVGKTEISDLWHQRLQEEGFKSWTQNLFTIFFGRGTRQFEARAWGEGTDLDAMVEMATNTSRFEKGLWDVLATFGLVGLVLYALLLLQIIRTCLPILFRDRIATPLHAIMFIAVYWCVAWFLLCWIAGSFPSDAILFGVVALVAAHDVRLDMEARTKRRVNFRGVMEFEDAFVVQGKST